MNYKDEIEKFGISHMEDIFEKEITFKELTEHLLRDGVLFYYVVDVNGNLIENENRLKDRISFLNIEKMGDNLYKSHHKWSDGSETIFLKPRCKNFRVLDKDKHKSGIYKIQLNNDIYIGQTMNFWRRFYSHMHPNKETKPSKLINMGGVFEILEMEEDKEKRLIRERYFVDKYNNDGYNVINSITVLFNGSNKLIRQKRLAEPKMGITFNKSDLEKITKLLSDNNIDFKPHKFRDKKETN